MKVLLVENTQPTAESLAAFLTIHRCVVDVTADEAVMLDMQRQRDYDIVLLDEQLPALEGTNLCRQLRKQGCTAPILILLAQTNADTVVKYLESGADDCITQPFHSTPFLVRLRAWQRRNNQEFAESALYWGELKLDPNLLQVTFQNREVHLSTKEYNLLELLMRNPQRAYSRDAILDQLWTFEDFPAPATVTNLVKDLRQKLRSAGVPGQPVKTIYGLGYRLNSPPAKLIQPCPTVCEPSVQALPVPDLTQVLDIFRKNVQERLALINAVTIALNQDALTPDLQRQARDAAHQLAGGLSVLGYGQGAYIMKAIEHLLTEPGVFSPTHVKQFNQLQSRLHHILTQPPSFQPFPSSADFASPELAMESQVKSPRPGRPLAHYLNVPNLI